jgi:hypothetical protein
MSVDNRTQLNDCENFAGGWTAAAQGGDNTTTGQFYEGTGSVESQHSNADEETFTNQETNTNTTFNLDWSDTTVYMLIKDNLVDTFANGGVQWVIGDGSNRIGYDVGGNDAVGLVLKTGFASFRMDVSAAAATPSGFNAYAGTEAGLNQGAITQAGYGSLHLAKAVGNVPNVFIDSITYITNDSYALTINGGTVGTPETMSDVAADDITNGWGMIGSPLGMQYLFGAPTEWGNSTATADSYFESNSEQWYFIGDNAGGRALGATHFPFRVVGNATDTISFVLNNTVIVNTATRAQFDVSDVNVNILKLTGVSFTGLGAITLPVQSIGNKFLESCTFDNCDKVIVSTIDIDNLTVNGSSDADGAILLDANQSGTQNITNVTFNSDGTGHGVHINPTGAGPFTYNFDNWKFNDYATDVGTAADRAVYVNPVTSSADITINILNGGDTPSTDQTGYTGTLTINNSVTITVTGVSEGTSVQVIANETAGTVTTGDVLGQGLADSAGEFSFSLNFEAAFGTGLDVIVRCRNQGFPTAGIAASSGGTAFTDETTNNNSAATNDITLLPASPTTNDAYYWGHSEKFNQLKLEVSTAADSGFATLTWEYWNGSSWASLPNISDGTNNYENEGINTVSWTDPTGWATTSVNSQGPYYYVRARQNSLSVGLTQPKGRKVKLDVTRYLPFTQNNTITNSGLDALAVWIEDTISSF